MGKNIIPADLPVLAYRQEILMTVAANAVTVITAETGAGKSTQVPRFLAEAGYRVVVTQPRRLAARTLAQRVANEMETRLGDRVGFRTAEERADSAATEVLFVTDGLQLVRELAGQGGTGRKTVLVLDEVHEWNLNMEVLVAWSRQRVAGGDDLRVVLMSATLDAEGMSSFFGTAPVISVPGRLYPVEKRSASARMLLDQTVELAKAGRNVLVFQPGKKEITETVSALQTRLGAAAIVLPLHGGLEPAEQQRCFDPAPNGTVKVVVATNVAQTSVTIPDIDAVVDSGVERRIELRDGIEGLYLLPTSQADCAQRAGRAGRTKAGVYVLCSETSEGERPSFPKAEVLRSRLDQMVLRLAVQGFDATALKFFHQPDETVLAEARRALVALGAMTSDGSVTKTGRRMARFPVSVGFARMLIEAERLGVVEQVATIAACLEAGDIRARDNAWKSLTQERRSDLLAVLDVYNAGLAMKGGGKSKAEALRDAGVFAKYFFRAGEIRRKLLDMTGRQLRAESKRFASKDEEREAVLRACVAGMVDHLYSQEYGRYRNGGNGTRELARESVVTGRPEWLVGLPFDISGKDERGRTFVLNLVGMATAVDPAWLVEVAPHLAEAKVSLRPTYSPEKDVVTSVTETYFNGRKIGEETAADGDHPEAAEVFARWLSGRTEAAGTHLDAVLRSNAARQERARQLNTRMGEETFKIFSSDEIFERFVTALSGARRIVEVNKPEALALPALDEGKIVSVLRDNPDTIEALGSELAVEYRAADYYGKAQSPRVKLSEEFVAGNRWLELPNDGVCLPGGRSVEVVVSFGYYTTLADTNIPQLKAKVREHLNREQWERWGDKPVVEIPDPKVESSEVPFVVAVYGQCTVTGEGLEAYGTIEWDSWNYRFSPRWYRDLDEAQAACYASCQKLKELEAEVRAEREREAAKAQAEADLVKATAEAEAAREELRSLRSDEGWYDFEYALRRKAEERTGDYSYLPSTAKEIREWTVETKAITAEVKTALAELKRQREEAARAREAAEQEKRAKLADLLAHDWVRDDLELAGRIDAFVREAMGARGAQAAARILREESEADYGRGSRTNALIVEFRGVHHHGLDWAAGRDIEAAAFWAETLSRKGKASAKKAPPATAPTVPAKPAAPEQVSASLDALKARFGGGDKKKRR